MSLSMNLPAIVLIESLHYILCLGMDLDCRSVDYL